MIEQVMVKDYILFEHAFIDFSSGMSVITGETGAGKSLLIDAIHLLSGDRISGNVVRKGKDKAILQMSLTCDNPEIIKELEDNGFEVEESLLIQRTITSDNKSTIRINQQMTTLGFVKQLVSRIIDIHSQMDTYQLMDKRVQLDLLDQYAKTIPLRKQVQKDYQDYKSLKDEYDTLVHETYSDEELDYLTHQYNQIEQAAIAPDELESLQTKIKEISQADQHLDAISQSIYSIGRDGGITDGLYNSFKSIEKIESLSSFHNELKDMYYRLNEIKDSLQAKIDFYQSETQDLDSLQAREFEIRSLYKRFGGNYEALMTKKEQLLKQIDQIIHREDVLKRLEAQIQEKENKYIQNAEKLSKQRLNAFSTLSLSVEKECHELMLEHAQFKIQRDEKAYSSDGIDDIEFMISMNPGSAFSSLKDSASGGELSRLMLALKVVFQSQQGIQTIIFDEIDTGVSGKVAFAMGQKMLRLSQNYQVLCITHLASVAAAADHHFKVMKETDGNNTITSISLLDDSLCIEELATMSSGTQSDINVEAAKELKMRARHG